MSASWQVSQRQSLSEADIAGLCALLRDCVEGGASVSFMHPLCEERARAFWEKVAADVRTRARIVLVAEDGEGICGTVQVCMDLPENQPHRADVAKMLVHRRARRRGLGAQLLRAAETAASANGKTLLVLDTVTGGDGARLYERRGWIRVGDVPAYALFPKGGYCGTTFYYRDLSKGAASVPGDHVAQ